MLLHIVWAVRSFANGTPMSRNQRPLQKTLKTPFIYFIRSSTAEWRRCGVTGMGWR